MIAVERKFSDMDFTLTLDGIQIATGNIFKIPSLGGQKRNWSDSKKMKKVADYERPKSSSDFRVYSSSKLPHKRTPSLSWWSFASLQDEILMPAEDTQAQRLYLFLQNIARSRISTVERSCFDETQIILPMFFES